MCKILLSINPEHVENILTGTKQYEFRKVKCKEKIDKILIYSTAPVMKVVGEVEVVDVIVSNPNEVWNETSQYSGISKQFFDDYYKNKSRAIAYKLGKVVKYDRPLELSEFGLTAAPQSFVYI